MKVSITTTSSDCQELFIDALMNLDAPKYEGVEISANSVVITTLPNIESEKGIINWINQIFADADCSFTMEY